MNKFNFIFIIPALAAAGYFIYMTTTSDRSTYKYTQNQVRDILMNAKTTTPPFRTNASAKIWGATLSDKGVTLRMKFGDADQVRSCQAIITSVTADTSRVLVDCGVPKNSTSALARMEAQLKAPMFDEFVQSTLKKRSFDIERVRQMEMAITVQNLNGMQHEGLQRADEHARMTRAQN
jgi:hypothetical protein